MLDLEKANAAYTKKEDDEIDLLELLIRAIYFIKKHLLLIISLIIAGIAFSILLYFRADPYYKARMLLNSTALSNPEAISIVDSWKVHLDKREYDILARKLNIEEPVTRKIISFEAKETDPEANRRALRPEEDDGSFALSVVVSDTQILDTLQSAIVNFLEKNEYVRVRSALKKANYERLRSRIINEIADLDSIKFSVKRMLDKGTASSGTFLSDPAEINSKIVELYDRALNIETSIQLVDDIQVIEGFTKSSTPDGPDLIKYLSFGVLTGFLLSCLVIGGIFVNNRLHSYREQ